MMIADSDAFHPPVNEDNALLMNLFRGMEKPEVHVSALMQIAENSDTAGRVFDSYAPGKDLDLPLLIACYQAPDTLLRGDRAILSYFLAGFKKKQRQERFPLCCRHLGQFM